MRVFPRLVWAVPALALTAATLLAPAAVWPGGGPASQRLDAYGDPLPPGATARFGSLRWRVPGPVRALAVSPDGKRAASVNSDGRVTIWDMASGRQLHDLAGSEAGERCVAFSPDGRYLTTGGQRDARKAYDLRVRVWDVGTGKQRACFARQRDGIVQVAFAPDGKRIVSAGDSEVVTVWEFPGGRKLREFMLKPGGGRRFALAQNGRWLAVADDQETLQVHDFDTGKRLKRFKTEGYLHGFCFSLDGRSLLIASSHNVSYRELATGDLRWQVALDDAWRFHFHPAPGGRKIAVLHGVAPDHRIRWMEASTGKLLGSWRAPPDEVSALAFSADGRTLVTGGWDAVRIWDTAAGKIVRGPTGPRTGCYSLAFSPDGKTVVAGSADLHILDGLTLRELGRFHGPAHRHWGQAWRSIAVSPDGTLAAAVGVAGETVLVDTKTGKHVRTLRGPSWVTMSLAFGPDGKKLYAVGRMASALRVWDVATGDEEPPLCDDLVRGEYTRANLASDRAGAKLATMTYGPKARCRLWDLHTGRELESLDETGDRLLYSDNGQLLAVYHYNSHINVWDVARRVKRLRIPVGPDGLSAWTFSADGRLLVTAHWDRSFVTWRLADGKKEAEVRGHSGSVVALACSPDGVGLVSACSLGTVLRWEGSAWQGK